MISFSCKRLSPDGLLKSVDLEDSIVGMHLTMSSLPDTSVDNQDHHWLDVALVCSGTHSSKSPLDCLVLLMSAVRAAATAGLNDYNANSLRIVSYLLPNIWTINKHHKE